MKLGNTTPALSLGPNLSRVGLGFDLCPICGAKHNEAVLLDRRLRNTLARENFLDYTLCPDHKAMKAEYIGLVEADSEDKTKVNLHMDEARRTGRYMMMRRSAASRVFTRNTASMEKLEYVFIQPDAFDLMLARAQALDTGSQS